MTDEQSRSWRGAADGWVENQQIFDAVFAPITSALLGAARITAGQRLLDVGCGAGTLLAAGADAGAEVVGVDISPVMVQAAQRRAPSATVLIADAERADLLSGAPGAPFDRIVSRFGVMFFADPVAAFANIRRAAAPGALLAFVCWRGKDENPMFSLGTRVLTERLAAQASGTPEAVSGAPSATSFADPDHLTSVLTRAGWAGLSLRPLDTWCDHGQSGGDGVEDRLAVILATSTGQAARQQLEPLLGPEGWAALLDEVRAELHAGLVDGAVRFPAATWLATATNPD